MTSTRLPGKVLMEACGKPLLELLVERLLRISILGDVIVATTTNEADDPICALAKRLGVKCHRGSEEDVLGRVLGAARAFRIDIIVLITGDCPLIDPYLSLECVEEFLRRGVDYASLSIGADRGYPLGLSTQVFTTSTLSEVESECRGDERAREHVTLPIYEQPGKYSVYRLDADPEYRRSEYRLTLDTKEDYFVIRSIFEGLYPQNSGFGLRDILQFLDDNPEIGSANRHVEQRIP